MVERAKFVNPPRSSKRPPPAIDATPKSRYTLIKYLLSKGSYVLGAGPVRYLGTPGTIESFEEGRSCFDERRFEPPLNPRGARVRRPPEVRAIDGKGEGGGQGVKGLEADRASRSPTGPIG